MATLKRLFAPLLLVAVLVVSWTSPLDKWSTEQVDSGLKRALVTFATARTLNAVISVAQGTDVAFEPGGVGVKFAPGELLDPINDLVEKFSTLMLFASISFGIQKILIEVGGSPMVFAALASAAVLWSVLCIAGWRIPEWCSKLLVIALVLRFAVPLATIGSHGLFDGLLAKKYESSQALLDSAAKDANNLSGSNAKPPESQGMLDLLKSKVPDFNIEERTRRFKEVAERWAENMVDLMVVFLLQTLIFPLLLLWGMLSFAKSMLLQFPPDVHFDKAP